VDTTGTAVPGPDRASDALPARGSERSAAQLDMLHSLARRLNQLRDVAQIGEAIAAELRTVIDYHNCRVHLLSDDGTMLVPVAFRGELSEYQGETFDALLLHVGQGITGMVAQSGVAYYAPNTNDDPHAVNIAGTPDVDESLMVVPMKYTDRVIGTVALAKLGVDQFDGQDLTLLEVLASHAAVAIENARLLEQAREAARLASELLKFSQALTRVNDVPSVLSEVVATIPALIVCSGVNLFVRNNEDGSFRMVASGEDQGPDELVVPREVAEPFATEVDGPFVLSEADRASVPPEYRSSRRGDVLVAPFRWEPDGLGAVVIFATENGGHAFGRRDLDYARGIADITALAVGNATRFQGMEQTAERLRALDEMKNMFLDAVSHELRTPLAAVLGIALTLQNQDVELAPEEVKDLVGRLATNARKLSRLLSDLLDLGRLARGIVAPQRRPVDLCDLVCRTIDEAGLGPPRVVLELTPVVTSVDPAKVERIVENLLSNAVRHTPADTPIRVILGPCPGGVLLRVEDEGPGVPEELRDSIFEPFRQGPQRQAHAPGVGIGLSLVGKFAELHGGRAWVESAPGGGASFRVFLPHDEATDQEGDLDVDDGRTERAAS
jgi:two-component system, OmpR family, sensor histidine kinase KdpD